MVQRFGSRRLATVMSGSLILAAQACSVATPFPEWGVTQYGPVVWARVGRSLQLTSTTAPGGLTFRRLLDRRVTYRLRVAGSQVRGSTVGRLKFGSSEPEWFTAPNGGEFAFNIANEPSVELGLYSEKPHTYRLDELRIEECGRCLSDDALRRMLLKELPSLQTDLHQDRLAAARTLLDWSANIVHLGDPEVDTTTQIYAVSASQIYQDFWLSETEGASVCGGFAAFFVKLLSLFGYQAFTVDTGYSQTSVTHVTTVIAMPTGGKYEFYIFDPTFNGAYQDLHSGAYLSVAQLLAEPPMTRAQQFRTRPIKRDILFGEDDLANLVSLLHITGHGLDSCRRVLADATHGRIRCRDIPYNQSVIRSGWQDQLDRLHIGSGDDLLMTLLTQHVFSLGFGAAEVQGQFLDLLKHHAIQYGVQ